MGKGRPRLSALRIARRAVLALSLASGFFVAAQEPDAPPQPSDATASEVLSQLSEMVQPPDAPQSEDTAAAEEPTPNFGAPQANGLPPTTSLTPGTDKPNRFIRPDTSSRSEGASRFQSPSRTQKDDRRSRGRRSGSTGSSYDSSRGSDRSQANSLSGTNNAPITLDYASFKIIADHNIFDPNRMPHRIFSTPPRLGAPPSFDALTLVGTMTYEKGTFAFFDGTSSQYKKALKLSDAIVGYKLTAIAPNAVKLAAGTNELELTVGAQLRREENGPWRLAGQSLSAYPAAPAFNSTNAAALTTTNSSDAASSGADSDILKRLMEKREKE